MSGRSINLGIVVIILLAAIIIAGSITAWLEYTPAQPVEILAAPAEEIQATVYIGGAVNNPGLYPLKPGDSLQELLQATSGTAQNADLSRIDIYFPKDEGEAPQKVDLNRAEA
jgi:hypothetical protein